MGNSIKISQIHQKLTKIRVKKGITQGEMAEKLNIAANNYGKIERGETALSLEKLDFIAEIFGMTIPDIYYYQEDDLELIAIQKKILVFEDIIKRQENDLSKLKKITAKLWGIYEASDSDINLDRILAKIDDAEQQLISKL